jgi:hypothetical protein
VVQFYSQFILLWQVPALSSIMEEASRSGSKQSSDLSKTTSSQSQRIDSSVIGSGVADVGNSEDTTKEASSDADVQRSLVSVDDHHLHHQTLLKEPASTQSNLRRDLAGLRSQNRRTLWLLTYVALVTTFPILGSALLVRTRGRILDIVNRHWPKKLTR